MARIRAFRGPQTMKELLRMMDAADTARAGGAAADAVDDALRAAMAQFDPDSVRISAMLRDMGRGPGYSVPVTALDGLDVPPMRTLEDMAPEIARSARSYDGLWAAGRPEPGGGTANLRNQPHAKAAGLELRAAAEEAIRGQQQAAASEGLGRAAATLGAGGLAAMIAESTGRMIPSPAGMGDMESIAEAPEPAMPIEEMAPADDLQLPDVPIDLPEAMDPPDMYADSAPVNVPDLSPLDVMEDDPMATADLAQESRPLPASTPRLTPEEIEALRSQVVAIRDAQTGEAMDSFYPPESEEYKAEQRMKKMYPQLRRR